MNNKLRSKGDYYYPFCLICVMPVNELRAKVYTHFGIRKFGEPVEGQVHPAIWKEISGGFAPDHPNADSRMSHNLLKVPEEHRSARTDEKKLRQIVEAIPDIQEHLDAHPQDRKAMPGIFKDAVFWHGIVAPFYWRASTGQDPKYHKLIGSAAEGIPLEMNRENAKRAAQTLADRLEAKPTGLVTLMDVGTGPGNTSRFTLQELVKELQARGQPADLSRVRVVLNDVEKSVDSVADKFAGEEFKAYGLKRENVHTMATSFFAASQVLNVPGMPKSIPWPMADEPTEKLIKSLEGRVDVLVSGASFNNLPHSSLAFRTVHALLAKGGKAHVWDWGGYDVSKKTYTQKQLDRVIHTTEGAKVTVRENIKGFWRFWLEHHGYTHAESRDETWWKRFEHYVDSKTNNYVDPLDWFTRYRPELEAHRNGRAFTTFGHANRAYRTPEDVSVSARKAGFRIDSISYPVANREGTREPANPPVTWDKPNPRFVTWQATLAKTGTGSVRRTRYAVGKFFKGFTTFFKRKR